MSNELATTQGTSLYRASTDAASICKDIVVATARQIGDRKYVQVEGWQAIAVAHGCAASAVNVEKIEGGFRATGQVRRMSDGALIAEAEGFVGEDEPTWFGGVTKRWKWGKERGEKVWFEDTLPKRPDYAIRAMAQTRAISRACRSAFAHVVVMMNANLSTTPAEEVPEGGFNDDHHNTHESADKKASATAKSPEKQEASPEPKKLEKPTGKTVADFCQGYEAEISLCDTEEKLDILVKRNALDMSRLADKHKVWHDKLTTLLDKQRASFAPPLDDGRGQAFKNEG